MMSNTATAQHERLSGLNDAQKEAVLAPIDSALRVMAGAGTGKTRIITERFVKLVNDLNELGIGNPETKLWVSTFTVKAAEEMKTRIVNLMPELSEAASRGQLWIGTFHSLCQRILKEQSSRFPELTDRALFTDIETNALREELVEAVLENPAEQVKEIIQNEKLSLDSNLLSAESLLSLDISDPEDLMTEIVFEVIPRIKAAGYSPIHFYEDAISQAERVSQLLATLPVSTIDSAPWESHDDYAKAWTSHLQSLSDETFSFYPLNWVIELEAFKSKPRSESTMLKDMLKPFYDFGCYVSYDGRQRKAPFSPRTRNTQFVSDVLASEKKLIGIVTLLYAWYQNALNKENAFDYDDLMLETIRLLKTDATVRAEYRKRFAHFLVDEFQDSNGLQLQLIKLFQDEQSPTRLTVVGDIKQSIYRFRFAEPQNLHVLFENMPHTKTIHLSNNYRSHADILAMANRITDMMNHKSDHHLIPSTSINQQDAAITWQVFEDATSTQEAKDLEGEWISENIQALLDSKAYLPTQIAVLVPRNMRALDIEETLEAHGIPAVKQRNHGFFSDPAIDQAVCFLHLIDEPSNDLAMAALLQHKLTPFELATLARYKKQGRFVNWYSALSHLVSKDDNPPAALNTCFVIFELLTSILDYFLDLKESMAPDQLFQQLIKTLPLVPLAIADTRPGQKTKRNLELLVSVLAHWTNQPKNPRTLTQVLKLLSQAQAKNELELPFDSIDNFAEEAVRILTFHGSKGLEFPVVFLAGVQAFQNKAVPGKGPSITVDLQYSGKAGFGLFLNKQDGKKSLKRVLYETVWHKPREEAEQLRLFYVAVTRAKQKLFITSWKKSFAYLNPVFFKDLAMEHLIS